MTDIVERLPKETRERGVVSEISEKQTLNNATLEPGTFIEETKEFMGIPGN